MGYADLVALKPKRLSDSLYAWLNEDTVVLNFGATKIVLKGNNGTGMPSCTISIARLFNADYESAVSLHGAKIDIIDIDNISWIEIPINSTDVSIFNSVASTGEDLFWQGVLCLNGSAFKIDVQGLVYLIRYEMAKITSSNAIIPADFNVFWYLYQMFKDVTKKRLGILKIGTKPNDPYIYMTNEDHSFFIVTNPEHREYIEKSKSFKMILDAYEAIEYERASEFSKKAMTLTPLQKHLLKMFDDIVRVEESVVSTCFSSAFCNVHINKQKGK